uniref:RING-CH-type domain-containing protein n=1 Tax=Strongyloides papillosus TaxID=174720 RepID=A0A0N5C4A4_STREA
MSSNDISTVPLCNDNSLICQICKQNGKFLHSFQYEPSNGMALIQPCKCNSHVHWRCWLRYWYNHQEKYFRFCKLCGDFYHFDFDKKIDLKRECFICKEKYFIHSKRFPLQDTRWIKPCLCDKKVHHGCIISIYDLYKKCPDCHSKPVLKTYGSIIDMMRRYSCSTTLFVILLIIGILLIYLITYHFFPHNQLFYRNIIFIIVIAVYLSTFLSMTIRFYYSRYPKFKKRYANKVVVGNEQV